MLNIGPQELLMILVIALVVVGPQRLPALGRSIGKGLREIRRAQDDVKRTIKVNLDEETADRGLAPPTGSPDGPVTAGPAATVSDPAPSASEPLPASEVREISRSLGRGLAELRRAREEVQRSFRVDLNGPARRAKVPADRTDPEPRPSGGDQAAG